MIFGRPSLSSWRRRLTQAAALLAAALFSLATVQSLVMQATDDPAAMWPICSVGSAGSGSQQTPADKAAHAACAVCAAASHAPLTSTAAEICVPSAVVWTPSAPTPSLGPRGPPRFRARARAPPTHSLTV